jgi:hypothetical protein
MLEPTEKLPAWLVELFPPDRRIAVEFFRKFVDESMLLEIANADYQRDVEAHLSPLTSIWNGEDWSELNYWFPMEVLELIRWSEPEISNWAPGSQGLRGHIMRAFSCAVLLATSNFEPEKQTLIQLLNSAFVIGGAAPQAVARFLTWKIPLLEREDDKPFFALAVAAIARIDTQDLSSDLEQSLAAWVETEEQAERLYRISFDQDHERRPWLFGLSWSDMLNDAWMNLILKLQCDYQGGAIEQMLTRCFGECRVREIGEIPSADS